MPYWIPILIPIIILGGVWAVWWLAAAVKETLAWSISGETGALLFRGFGSSGVRMQRTAELRAVIAHIALITRLNLPLPSALRAAAKGESGSVGKALSYMGYLVGTGWPISAAVWAAFRGCPVQLVAILRRGEQCGQIRQAITDVERTLAATVRGHRTRGGYPRYAGAYAGMMLVFSSSMLAYIMVIIMPRFWDIFRDFETPLPAVTVALIDFSRWLVAHGGLLLAVLLLCVLLAVMAGVWLRGREKPGMLAHAVSAVRWAIPITRTIDYGLGMAAAIRSMAMDIRSGTAVDRAAVLTSTVGVTNHLRYRLADFGQEVHAGAAPHVAAQRAKLGDVFVSALKMIERGEDAERVLGHAADYYEAIAHRWWHAIAALSEPLVTLAIAGIVSFLVFALFLPLVALIDSVSGTIL